MLTCRDKNTNLPGTMRPLFIKRARERRVRCPVILGILLTAVLAVKSHSCSADEGLTFGAPEAALVVHAVDWVQTRTISRDCHNPRPGFEPWHETNPLLGNCPGMGKVNGYFLLSGALLYAGSKYLPQPWAKVVSYSWLTVETVAVGHNVKLGIRVGF